MKNKKEWFTNWTNSKKKKIKVNEVDESKYDNHFGIMWCETKLKAKVKDFGHWKHFNKSRALKTLKGDRGLHDFYSIWSPLVVQKMKYKSMYCIASVPRKY